LVASAQTVTAGKATQASQLQPANGPRTLSTGRIDQLHCLGTVSVNATTGQATWGGIQHNRANDVVYDNTDIAGSQGQYVFGGILSPPTDEWGDFLINTQPGDNLNQLDFTIVNYSSAVGMNLLQSNVNVMIRDYADPMTFTLGSLAIPVDFTNGGLYPNGLEVNYYVVLSVTGITGIPVPYCFEAGYYMDSVIGTIDTVGQIFIDQPLVGLSQDDFLGVISGGYGHYWFGGPPSIANAYYYAVVDNALPNVAPPRVYEDVADAGFGYGPVSTSFIFDDLEMTAGGTVDYLEWTLFNTSADTLMTTDLTIELRDYDPVSNAYITPGQQITGSLDFSGGGGLPSMYYSVITASGLSGLGVIVTPHIQAGVSYQNTAPATVANLGMIAAFPATIGNSLDSWVEEDNLGNQIRYWWGGPPNIGNWHWVVEVVPSVLPCPGDFNCDGLIGFEDIDPLIAVLSGGACCDPTGANCDVDGDGGTGFSDIDPFIGLLSSGATCP
jgi:hypothetical protein